MHDPDITSRLAGLACTHSSYGVQHGLSYPWSPGQPLQTLFGLDDAKLRDRGVVCMTADSESAFPSRVSLKDAQRRNRSVAAMGTTLMGDTVSR